MVSSLLNLTQLTDVCIRICLSLAHTPSSSTDGTGAVQLWTANEPIEDCIRQYGFTRYSLTLNEEDDSEYSFFPPYLSYLDALIVCTLLHLFECQSLTIPICNYLATPVDHALCMLSFAQLSNVQQTQGSDPTRGSWKMDRQVLSVIFCYCLLILRCLARWKRHHLRSTGWRRSKGQLGRPGKGRRRCGSHCECHHTSQDSKMCNHSSCNFHSIPFLYYSLCLARTHMHTLTCTAGSTRTTTLTPTPLTMPTTATTGTPS